ncbi:MAG: NAD-dependent epimerase/dehydratase family protein [bacterium]
MKVLITGAKGFVGKNLCASLRLHPNIEVLLYDIDNTPSELEVMLEQSDVIFHIAAVHRPQQVEEFNTVNVGLTSLICEKLIKIGRTPKIILTSSIHAELDNPYGESKRGAEEELKNYADVGFGESVVYRLNHLFGKWSTPNHHSVTATFCYNIARDLPIQVSNPANELRLTYIDEVMSAFIAEVDAPAAHGFRFAESLPSHAITLGMLADLIRGFHAHRQTLMLADYSDPFVRALYATYLSYLDTDDFGYGLDIKSDNRGSLAEFIKSPYIGQLFISRTNPGITRGNHYHQTKTEKFMVVQGEGVIRFRHINGTEVLEYPVRGEEYRVVDIPPGYTHHIENVGTGEMVTLFWSSNFFDPDAPDTYFEAV